MLECVAAQQASGGLRLERHLWGDEGAVVSTCMLGERMCIGTVRLSGSGRRGEHLHACREDVHRGLECHRIGCEGAVKEL